MSSKISIVFVKEDLDEMVFDTDSQGNDEPFNLTDEEWEWVVAHWRKSDSAVMEACWEVLDGLGQEARRLHRGE